MLRFFNILFIYCLLSNLQLAQAIESDWGISQESKARIISPSTHNTNQTNFYLGLEYELSEGWKTYWRSPGDGGFPQNINWSNSKNIESLQILWPTPENFEILGIQSIGYKNNVIFPLNIKIKDIKKQTLVNLSIDYLTCKTICIPGKAILNLVIPPGEGVPTKYYFIIEKSLSKIPEKNVDIIDIENYKVKAFENNDKILIEISVLSKNYFKNPEFFLDTKFGLPVMQPEIKFSNSFKEINAIFNFDKKIITKDQFNINVVLKDEDFSFQFSENILIEKDFNKLTIRNSFFYIIIISLVGGLILNVMPCVLPVISIKLLSIIKNSNEINKIRNSFFVTAFGVISSFVILSLVLIFLRILGIRVGWGMQFQQPVFLIIIALILLLFSLNLFGFFNFRIPEFVSFFYKKYEKKLVFKSYFNDFFNGFFATVLATPCSAPFVGTAITLAFTQSYYIMLVIFFFMGLGMASPYILIAIFPALIKFLPKPGVWMQYAKYILGLLLFGTFLWVGSIFINNNYFFTNFYQKIESSSWIDFNNVEIDNLIKEKKIIFVDITADWCATCQFNKIRVINSKIIKEVFKKNNVIKIRGDWTRPNKKIENYINQYNKFGIPLNIIYLDGSDEGIVLSELLSKKEIIEILKKNN